jgi:hypothetical protein
VRDVLGAGTVLGYCTNVHAGNTVDEALEQLERHAVEVKRLVSPDEPLDVGLWLPRSAMSPDSWALPSEPGSLLHRVFDVGLRPFTINAFPYGDFHGEVVKHRVYEPDWSASERFEYSFYAGEVLLPALERGMSGSVSTLPVGWPGRYDEGRVRGAGSYLRELAQHLRGWEENEHPMLGGRHITVDLEPEPGCILDTASDVIEFFDQELPEEAHRRYIGICHDVCHAAVMFEDQVEVLMRYAEAGIRVNKVQISNAPRVAIGGDRAGAFEMLRRFVEPRYLHQTMVADGERRWFFEDLPEALSALDDPRADVDLSAGEWRVHFHVPVYLESIGALGTTRDQILPAIRAAREYHDCRSFEVETYAWGVLPEELRVGTLAEGIARELAWVRDLAEGIT